MTTFVIRVDMASTVTAGMAIPADAYVGVAMDASRPLDSHGAVAEFLSEVSIVSTL